MNSIDEKIRVLLLKHNLELEECTHVFKVLADNGNTELCVLDSKAEVLEYLRSF